jgi:hypothetical protein
LYRSDYAQASSLPFTLIVLPASLPTTSLASQSEVDSGVDLLDRALQQITAIGGSETFLRMHVLMLFLLISLPGSDSHVRACIFAMDGPLSSHVLSWVQQFEETRVPFSVLHVPASINPEVDDMDEVAKSSAAAACRNVTCDVWSPTAMHCMQCNGQFSRCVAPSHFLISRSGHSFETTCHVTVVDTGARAAADSCSSSFEGETDGVVSEPHLRHAWASSTAGNAPLHEPQYLQRLLRAALISTIKGGIIMGPSYWDTPSAQAHMADSRVHCAGGGGPCPALASGWVLGAAAWSYRVRPHLTAQILFACTRLTAKL